MKPLIIIIILFAVAITIGLFLISFVLRDKKPPLLVAIIHGLAAISGVSVLIAYSAKNHIADFTGVLALFCFAALGGITLVVRQLKGKPLPKWLAGVHGVLAMFAFIIMVVMIFTIAQN